MHNHLVYLRKKHLDKENYKRSYEAPATLESQYVDERSPFERGFDTVLDYFKGGGLLGQIGKGISSFSEGLQEKAISFSLNKKLSDIYEANPDFEDYESLDEIPGDYAKVRDLESDLQGLRDGTLNNLITLQSMAVEMLQP